MSLSAVAFALMALCVKLVTERLPSIEIVFFRSFFGMLITLFFLIKSGASVWGRERLKLVARGASGFLALILHFYTISKLGLGLAVMLNYTAPIFAVILAVFFLKEKPGFLVWFLIFLAFGGIILLNSSAITGWRPEVWLAILSSVFAALAYVSIRTIKHRESPLTIIFYFTWISTVGSAFFFKSWIWPDVREWFLIAGVVIFSFYGQLWMTSSLQQAPAYVVTPFQYLHPVISFLIGWILWKDPLTPATLAGIFLIVLSGSLISYLETRVRTREEVSALPGETSL